MSNAELAVFDAPGGAAPTTTRRRRDRLRRRRTSRHSTRPRRRVDVLARALDRSDRRRRCGARDPASDDVGDEVEATNRVAGRKGLGARRNAPTVAGSFVGPRQLHGRAQPLFLALLAMRR